MDDASDDIYGYMAALVAVFAYGSYGVPIKETLAVQSVHPLVIQSYKTITMSLMSSLLLVYSRSSSNNTTMTHWSFTKWGLLSGLLWVVGATFGIFAIRSAGMAQAIGTWASVMIAVNFVWGILVFQEPVASIFGALGAFGLLGLGLVGMSWYSAPQLAASTDMTTATTLLREEMGFDNSPGMRQLLPTEDNKAECPSYQHEDGSSNESALDVHYEAVFYRDDTEELESTGCNSTIDLFGRSWTLRAAGIAAAVANGILNGSAMIPLHYAKQEGYAGANYFMSFAIGALVANIVIWLLYYLVNVVGEWNKGVSPFGGVLRLAFAKFPNLHVQQLWFAGFSAGVLLSIAMFGSILSVTYLGQGVGNSIVQAKIFVSGLWGIFYYKEITGRDTISKWFLSAAVTVTAIVWLTYERLTAGHR